MNTLCGGIVSCLIIMMTIASAANTSIELIDPQSPTVSKVNTLSYYENEYKLPLSEFNFKIAFTLYDLFGQKNVNDSKYAKWWVNYVSQVDGVQQYDILGFHECTEQDYAEFFPVRKLDAESLQTWQARGLYCLDELGADEYIGGTFQTDSHRGIHITFGPCNINLEDQGATPTEDCIADLDQQREYLGSPMLAWYVNSESFDQHLYGESAIIKESKVFTSRIEIDSPSWQQIFPRANLLNDETAFVQIGQSESRPFYDFDRSEIRTSSWNAFPTPENPNSKFKFTSLQLFHQKDLTEVNRKTYSLLDWLGDWGGLMDALFFIASIFVKPFAVVALNARLVKALVGVKKRADQEDRNVVHEFKQGEEETVKTKWIQRLVHKYRRSKEQRILNKSLWNGVIRELDLVKLLRKLKMLVLSSLGSLTAQQRVLIDKMSEKPVQSGVSSSSDPDLDKFQRSQVTERELKWALNRVQGSAKPGSRSHTAILNQRFLQLLKLNSSVPLPLPEQRQRDPPTDKNKNPDLTEQELQQTFLLDQSSASSFQATPNQIRPKLEIGQSSASKYKESDEIGAFEVQFAQIVKKPRLRPRIQPVSTAFQDQE